MFTAVRYSILNLKRRELEEAGRGTSGILAEPLDRLLREPVLLSACISEVHVVSVFKLIRDEHFAHTDEGLEEFQRWVLDQNRALLSIPLYRVLRFKS